MNEFDDRARSWDEDLARSDMAPLLLDLAAGPPPARQYDLICTQMTLHHVEDVDAVLRAFGAMVRPGGYVCIADLDTEDGSFHGADFKGHRGFARAALKARAEAAGLTPCSCDTCHVLRRTRGAGVREYSLFLLVCRREAAR